MTDLQEALNYNTTLASQQVKTLASHWPIKKKAVFFVNVKSRYLQLLIVFSDYNRNLLSTATIWRM